MYINIYSYVNSHVVLVVSNYLVINIFRGNSKYMNIHVYCTCIRAHILTTIVPKQGFTLKKKILQHYCAKYLTCLIYDIRYLYCCPKTTQGCAYISLFKSREACINISKSCLRIMCYLQSVGIEKPSLHNFTWNLVHKHMFGMRLRDSSAIHTDMKTIQKHVIKKILKYW